jgi:hypothetical protein
LIELGVFKSRWRTPAGFFVYAHRMHHRELRKPDIYKAAATGGQSAG